MGDGGGVKVSLHLYDLSQGMARAMSTQLLGTQIDGVWHTGVVRSSPPRVWRPGAVVLLLLTWAGRGTGIQLNPAGTYEYGRDSGDDEAHSGDAAGIFQLRALANKQRGHPSILENLRSVFEILKHRHSLPLLSRRWRSGRSSTSGGASSAGCPGGRTSGRQCRCWTWGRRTSRARRGWGPPAPVHVRVHLNSKTSSRYQCIKRGVGLGTT
jgi:hypothetical protein